MFPTDPDTGKVIFSDVDYLDTWKAMEKVHTMGLAKSIGISNFNSLQIERLLMHAKIVPVTNQVSIASGSGFFTSNSVCLLDRMPPLSESIKIDQVLHRQDDYSHSVQSTRFSIETLAKGGRS